MAIQAKRYFIMPALSISKILSYLTQLAARLAISEISYQEAFEKGILKPSEKRLLEMPLDEYDFPIRVHNALANAKLKTLGDVLNFGLNNLLKIRNFGVKSFNEFVNSIGRYLESEQIEGTHISKVQDISNEPGEVKKGNKDILGLATAQETSGDYIKNTIEDFLLTKQIAKKEQKTLSDNDDENTHFIDMIENILSKKQLQIVKLRYGYEDGKKKTLEQVGKKLSLTRERVRQIIVKAHYHLKHPARKKYFQEILEHIESALLHNRGIVGVDDLSNDEFFSASTKKQLEFLLNLLADLYEERYRIIEKRFLTSLSDDEIRTLQLEIQEAVLKCRFPIQEKSFIEHIISAISPISKDYLTYYLLYKERIVISKGKVLSPGRLSIPQRVKLLMKDIDRPMHFTEIAKLYRDYFGDKKIKTKDLEHAIHARIGDSKDFIIVGPGTFILRDKFKIPDNINEIVEISKEILQSLKTISDTKYLISELKKRNIDVGILNEYSLKSILLEYPGFIKYRKFEIGIEELADKYERKSLSDLIYEVLRFVNKPLHVKEIWKHISKQRGFPIYAIEQRLYDEPQFIKIAPSTYTVKDHIASYEEKCKLIINFTKEWINLKGYAVSAFFVNEVLKATEEIKDLSLGLVEHVLATSPEFIKLPNGFYDLADKAKEV